MAVDIAQLLAFAVKNNASDCTCRRRTADDSRGRRHETRQHAALAHKEVHSMVYDIMNDKQRKAFEEFFETDFSSRYRTARFRVNAFNQNRGAARYFAIFPRSS